MHLMHSAPITVVADTADFLLVDKPAGMSFHRDGDTFGVLDWVRSQTGLENLHPIHRLDRITSGLLMFAKGADAAAELSALFATHAMRKYYLALADRSPKKKQGTVRGGMEKGRNGSWRFTPIATPGALPAATQFFCCGLGNGLRLFLLRPLTGRTHQIRVAMKSLGSPILGDARYAGEASDRGYLHAYALEFSLCGETFRYVCPPKAGEHWHTSACQSALMRYTEPWSLAWPKADAGLS